jgi:hypothetical protein
MPFEAAGWFGMQKQSQVARFSPFGTQKPIEFEHFVLDGIDFEIWLFEELGASLDFQLNTFTSC